VLPAAPAQTPSPFALVCSPDALALRSRDTLNNLITKSPQSWQTSVALPFFNIQGTVVEWGPRSAPTNSVCPVRALTLPQPFCADEIRFDVRLMQRVPYEGVSRMQTSLRRFVLPR